jgi:hypothetical protein
MKTMDELEARAGALLRTGARDQQAWVEAWTRSPAVWSRLPALLSGPAPSPAARPFLCAAAVASCAAPGVTAEWRVAVARAVLALSPSHAVRCDAATVMEAAVAGCGRAQHCGAVAALLCARSGRVSVRGGRQSRSRLAGARAAARPCSVAAGGGTGGTY